MPGIPRLMLGIKIPPESVRWSLLMDRDHWPFKDDATHYVQFQLVMNMFVFVCLWFFPVSQMSTVKLTFNSILLDSIPYNFITIQCYICL